MDEAYVKDYFSKPGTVSLWWEPEQGDKSHIFEREINVLRDMLDGEDAYLALDVACGKGRISRTLNQIGIDTISLDISQEMLDIGQKRGNIVRSQIGDGEKLPFNDNAFDVVICMDSLVHFPNPRRAINEAYRVLKKDGVYVCSTSNPYDLGFLPRAIAKGIRSIFGNNEKNKGEGIFRYISSAQMKNALTENGFNIEKDKKVGVLAPIEVRGANNTDFYIFPASFSRGLQGLDRILEKIPLIRNLSIISIYKSRK
ncbi:MAG: class I SAM-dependent methyltransferase [Nanoarchaeota archaeon]|nr:class I SAM-dependent methyltransferase [Nanoarchaeota archaeon]